MRPAVLAPWTAPWPAPRGLLWASVSEGWFQDPWVPEAEMLQPHVSGGGHVRVP